MNQNDLVGLQNSSKSIRNPFEFDFTVKWDKRPITIPGDGKWYSVVGPLADHIARRLYMKIRYQYHDEQVAALRAKGDIRGARSYNVPIDVENKIWMLITGEPLHKNHDTAEDVQDEANLSVLRREIDKLEKTARANTGGINVTKILNKANAEAAPVIEELNAGGRARMGGKAGTSKLDGDTTPAPKKNTTPINVSEIQNDPSALGMGSDEKPDPAAEATLSEDTEKNAAEASDSSEFEDVEQLDNAQQ